MIELLKQHIELSRRMRWLKIIEKETDKRNKLYQKLNRQIFVIKELVRQYNEIFNEDLGTPTEKGGGEE